MSSGYQTSFMHEILLDIKHKVDRDALIPMRYLSVESKTVTSLEILDMTHFTLER